MKNNIVEITEELQQLNLRGSQNLYQVLFENKDKYFTNIFNDTTIKSYSLRDIGYMNSVFNLLSKLSNVGILELLSLIKKDTDSLVLKTVSYISSIPVQTTSTKSLVADLIYSTFYSRKFYYSEFKEHHKELLTVYNMIYIDFTDEELEDFFNKKLPTMSFNSPIQKKLTVYYNKNISNKYEEIIEQCKPIDIVVGNLETYLFHFPQMRYKVAMTEQQRDRHNLQNRQSLDFISSEELDKMGKNPNISKLLDSEIIYAYFPTNKRDMIKVNTLKSNLNIFVVKNIMDIFEYNEDLIKIVYGETPLLSNAINKVLNKRGSGENNLSALEVNILDNKEMTGTNTQNRNAIIKLLKKDYKVPVDFYSNIYFHETLIENIVKFDYTEKEIVQIFSNILEKSTKLELSDLDTLYAIGVKSTYDNVIFNNLKSFNIPIFEYNNVNAYIFAENMMKMDKEKALNEFGFVEIII